MTATTAPASIGGFGHSDAPDAAQAGRDAVLGALAGRTPAAGDLVLIFPSSAYDLDALHAAAIDAAAPAQVVGCTTVGAFTHEAQVPAGVAATYIAGDGIAFGVCHVELGADDDVAARTRQAAEDARDRAGAEREDAALIILCDALLADHREVARGAYEVTGAVVPLIGGAAGDDLRWQEITTFGEGRAVRAGGLVCVWIESDTPMGVGVGHGWRPFSKPMLVTRAEGTTVHQLDGMPAMDVYLSERGAALLDEGSFGTRAMERPLGVPNAHGFYDMRQIHMPGPDGSLVLAAAIGDGSVVQVMCSDDEGLLEGARQAARDAAATLDGPPRLAVVFSCCTRVPLLAGRLDEEVQAISSELGGAPAGGFYTCGEYARVSGSSGIHNSSVAVLAL